MKFTLRQTKEILTSQSGLALVGALLNKTGYKRQLNQLFTPKNRGNNLRNSDIGISMIGLLCQGKCDFENIEGHRADSFFKLALDLKRVPSASRLRQRVDEADEYWDEAAVCASIELLKNHAIQTPCYKDCIPLDVDVSIQDNSDSKKEGVSKTYKMIDGFAPIFAHIGTEGYLLNLEFREGKTHCQEKTDKFLEKTLSLVTELSHKHYLLRMDAGNDSKDNIIVVRRFNREQAGQIKVDYIIKRNLRRESKEQWLAIAREKGVSKSLRDGKTEYIGKVYRQLKDIDEPVEIVFKVTKITITSRGQQLLIPEIEVETYWNSLSIEPEEVFDLYHHHGTSEQYHSEFKSDIGLERLPSGYFETNTRVMFLALLVFNILRIMGQESLNFHGVPIVHRHRIRRRRLRSVIQYLIYLAARLIRHARYWTLGFGKEATYYETFDHLYLQWSG